MLVRSGQGQASSEIRVELALGLLLVEVNSTNAKVYQRFIDSFFTDLTLLEYLQYVDFLQDRSEGVGAL